MDFFWILLHNGEHSSQVSNLSEAVCLYIWFKVSFERVTTAKLLHRRQFKILTVAIVFVAVFTHRCIGTAGDNFKGVENQDTQ